MAEGNARERPKKREFVRGNSRRRKANHHHSDFRSYYYQSDPYYDDGYYDGGYSYYDESYGYDNAWNPPPKRGYGYDYHKKSTTKSQKQEVKNKPHKQVEPIVPESEASLSEEDKFLSIINHGNFEDIHNKLQSQQCKPALSQSALNSALLSLASRGLKFALQLVVGLGASVTHKDNDGNTALLAAAKSGYFEIMKYLLKKQSDVNARNNAGDTALFLCLGPEGSSEMVRLLLSHGANCSTANHEGMSPLMKAAQLRDVDVVKQLLEAGADKFRRSKTNGETAYEIARKAGLGDVFNMLTPGTTKSGKMKSRKSDESALLRAVKSQSLHSVEILLECEQPEVDKVCGNKLPLGEIINVFKSNKKIKSHSSPVPFKILKLLLENGADVNGQLKRNSSPLTEMATSGNCEGVKLLLDHGADLNSCTNSQGLTALMLAAQQGDKDLINLLLDHGARVTQTWRTEHDPVLIALKNDHIDCAQLLCRRGINLEVKVDYALKMFIASKRVKAVRFLIEKYAVDVNGEEFLHEAVRKGSWEVVDLLLQLGADVNMVVEKESDLPPVYHTGDLLMLKKLIAHGANVHHEHKFQGNLLTYSIIKNRAALIPFLIEQKVNVNKMDSIGKNPIMHVCTQPTSENKSKVELVKALLDAGTDPNSQSDYSGKTALHFAASLKLGMPHVSEEVDLAILKTLLEAGADITLRDQRGKSVVFEAVHRENKAILQLLIDHGVDVTQPDECGQTPLMIAVKLKNTGIIPLLAPNQAVVNAQDNKGMTALMTACQLSSVPSVQALLDLGAKADMVTKSGDSPDCDICALGKVLPTTSRMKLKGEQKVIAKALIRHGAIATLPARQSPLLNQLILTDQRELIQLAVTHGMGPMVVKVENNPFNFDTPVSHFAVAMALGKLEIAKYLEEIWCLMPSDLYNIPFPKIVERNNTAECAKLLDQMTSQVPSLKKLSFVTVSSLMGTCPGREERVRQLPIPETMKARLLFQCPDVQIDLTEKDLDGEDYSDISDDDDDGLDDIGYPYFGKMGSSSDDIYSWDGDDFDDEEEPDFLYNEEGYVFVL